MQAKTALLALLAVLTAETSAMIPEKYYSDPPPSEDWRTQWALQCLPQTLNSVDHTLAYRTLITWCDKFHQVEPADGVRVFRAGDAHAFLCTWGGRQPCSGVEFGWFDFWSGNASACWDQGLGWAAQHPYWRKSWGVVSRFIEPKKIRNLCDGEGLAFEMKFGGDVY